MTPHPVRNVVRERREGGCKTEEAGSRTVRFKARQMHLRVDIHEVEQHGSAGRKPRWPSDMTVARRGSTRSRTAFASNRLSVLTMDSGRTSAGA